MNRLPMQRNKWDAETKHHLLWRKKEWCNFSPQHKAVRQLGAYSVHLPRHWHDRLHATVGPVSPPIPKVVDYMHVIGREHSEWRDDYSRVEHIVDEMAAIANRESSPEAAEGLLTVMTHISSQLGILALSNSMK